MCPANAAGKATVRLRRVHSTWPVACFAGSWKVEVTCEATTAALNTTREACTLCISPLFSIPIVPFPFVRYMSSACGCTYTRQLNSSIQRVLSH